MLFEQFIQRIFFINTQKSRPKRVIPLLNPSKDEIERLALEKIGKLESNKQYKKALKAINNTINNGTKTNQILFKKAFLLSQNKQYKEALEIFEKLSSLINKPKLSAKAKQSLETTKLLQIQHINFINLLKDNLHAIAKQSSFK